MAKKVFVWNYFCKFAADIDILVIITNITKLKTNLTHHYYEKSTYLSAN